MGFCGVEFGKKWSLDKKDTANSATLRGTPKKNTKRIDELQIVFIVCQS